MKIGILTFGRPQTKETEPPYETKKIFEAALARELEARIFCEPFFSFREHDGKMEIFYDNEPMPACDVFIARTNFIEDFGLHSTTVDMLLSAGYKIINSNTLTSAATKNKLTRKLLLSQAGLPMPRSSIIRDIASVSTETLALGFPLVVKTPNGSGGRGVFLAENLETVLPIVDYLTVTQKIPVLLEEFIKEAEGKDIRVFVAGEKILAAMEREAIFIKLEKVTDAIGLNPCDREKLEKCFRILFEEKPMQKREAGAMHRFLDQIIYGKHKNETFRA